jgi:hypothetical protein
MNLVIQTLDHKSVVLTSLPVEQGELNNLQLVDEAIKQAKTLLHSDGFGGKNVRVAYGDQTVWQSYYGLTRSG